MLFFCQSLREFVKKRTDVLNIDDDEDSDEDEESENKKRPGEDREAINQAERRYNWLRQIDEVAHTKNVTWDDVWSMGVIEFFNIISYIKEKNRREQEEIKQWQMKHRH